MSMREERVRRRNGVTAEPGSVESRSRRLRRGEPPKSRKRAGIEARILDAAEEVFAEYGFRGASVQEVAARVGISLPNLLYYFKSKRALYLAVFNRIMDTWLTPLTMLDPEGDPAAELTRYIAEKVESARTAPTASRVFANEILHGAPEMQDFLRTELRQLVTQKAAAIRHWTASGKLAEIDPYHLIFLIWAATQHYADFLPQVKAVMNVSHVTREQFQDIAASLSRIILRGVLPERSRRRVLI